MKSILIILALIITGCSVKSYENEIFPKDVKWQPINPENFNKTEAQRIFEGSIGK